MQRSCNTLDGESKSLVTSDILRVKCLNFIRRWVCGWIAIASGVTWIVGIFTIRETAYYSRDLIAPASNYAPISSLRSTLGITSGYNKNLSFFTALYNNIAVAGYPAILWTGLTVGVFVGW